MEDWTGFRSGGESRYTAERRKANKSVPECGQSIAKGSVLSVNPLKSMTRIIFFQPLPLFIFLSFRTPDAINSEQYFKKREGP